MSIWAKAVIERIVANCATHCIGFYGGQQDFNFSRPCLWRSEDMFFGSCIHALFPKEIVIIEITNTSRALTRNNQPKLTEDNVVAIDRGGPAGIRSAHQFYTALENKNSHGH